MYIEPGAGQDPRQDGPPCADLYVVGMGPDAQYGQPRTGAHDGQRLHQPAINPCLERNRPAVSILAPARPVIVAGLIASTSRPNISATSETMPLRGSRRPRSPDRPRSVSCVRADRLP